jgi:hypothetical protein
MMREKRWKKKRRRKAMIKRGRLGEGKRKQDSKLKKTRIGIPGLY